MNDLTDDEMRVMVGALGCLTKWLIENHNEIPMPVISDLYHRLTKEGVMDDKGNPLWVRQ